MTAKKAASATAIESKVSKVSMTPPLRFPHNPGRWPGRCYKGNASCPSRLLGRFTRQRCSGQTASLAASLIRRAPRPRPTRIHLVARSSQPRCWCGVNPCGAENSTFGISVCNQRLAIHCCGTTPKTTARKPHAFRLSGGQWGDLLRKKATIAAALSLADALAHAGHATTHRFAGASGSGRAAPPSPWWRCTPGGWPPPGRCAGSAWRSRPRSSVPRLPPSPIRRRRWW